MSWKLSNHIPIVHGTQCARFEQILIMKFSPPVHLHFHLVQYILTLRKHTKPFSSKRQNTIQPSHHIISHSYINYSSLKAKPTKSGCRSRDARVLHVSGTPTYPNPSTPAFWAQFNVLRPRKCKINLKQLDYLTLKPLQIPTEVKSTKYSARTQFPFEAFLEADEVIKDMWQIADALFNKTCDKCNIISIIPIHHSPSNRLVY